MSQDRAPRMPKWKRKPDGLLNFLTTQSRVRLVAWIAISYAAPVFIFAVAYWRMHLVTMNGMPVNNLGLALYFSLVTQATGGFLDLVTTTPVGRALFSCQLVIGLAWAAFLPAIVLIRLTQPDVRSLDFSDKIVFNPNTGRFAFRYASFSRLVIFHTDITIWLMLPAPRSGDYNNHPVRVRFEMQSERKFANIRPNVPFLVYTDPVDPKVAPAFPEHVEQISLHPGHMSEYKSAPQVFPVMIDIAGSTSVGSVHGFRGFRYSDIICGSMVDVQPLREGEKDWRNFNIFENRTRNEDGRIFCLRCPYRTKCGLINKYTNTVA